MEKQKRPKTGGRQKGTPNKATRISRDLLNNLTAEMYETVLKDIAELDPADRVKVWLKLCEFNIPKPQTISLDMAVKTKLTIEDKLIELSGDDEDEEEEK